MIRARLGILIAVTAPFVSAATASASTGGGGSLVTALIGGSCGATTTPFAPWGDNASYYLVPNGGFENGSEGWTLKGGAAAVAGNEPFHVHASTDSHSLLIPAGGTALSGPICFGLLNSAIRFFAVSGGSKPAVVRVQVIASGLLGFLSMLDDGALTAGTSWEPTGVFSTTLSQLNVPVGAKTIQIEISASEPVRVDDIFIDPFQSH